MGELCLLFFDAGYTQASGRSLAQHPTHRPDTALACRSREISIPSGRPIGSTIGHVSIRDTINGNEELTRFEVARSQFPVPVPDCLPVGAGRCPVPVLVPVLVVAACWLVGAATPPAPAAASGKARRHRVVGKDVARAGEKNNYVAH